MLAILPNPKSSFVSWYLWSRSGLPMLATLISSTRGSSLPRRHCSAGETCALGGKSSVWDCVASSEHSCCSLQNGTDEGFFFSFLLIPIIRGSQLPSRQRLCAPDPFFGIPSDSCKTLVECPEQASSSRDFSPPRKLISSCIYGSMHTEQ